MSNQFYSSNELPVGNDIRSSYIVPGYSGMFQTFGDNLLKAPNPPDQNFAESDWQAVSQTIANECLSAYMVYTTYGTTIPQAAGNLNTAQQQDLTSAKNNIIGSLPAGYNFQPAPINYWGGQFMVAGVWGLAAITGDPAIGTIGSIFASLLGSGLTAQGSDTNALQQAYDTIDDAILAAFTDKSLSNATAPQTFLTDPVKLRIFYELSATTWLIPDVSQAVQAAFQGVDRGSMYAHLLPAVFTIAVIDNTVAVDYPFFLSGTPAAPTINRFGGSNPDSYDQVQIDGQWTIRALYVDIGTALSPSPVEPSAALTNDLKNIGVNKSDVLSGYGLWNPIPRALFSKGWPPGSVNGS
ncbi:MAG: hypothetical protein QOK37_327 [Thermoanaerobaculia bacterium]|nr:hypothetical protein [Thermoanaerobaculia bacterium]